MKTLDRSIPYAHPTDEALEAYLLGRHTDEDLEAVETHALACGSCVWRLERLETEVLAMKLALSDLSIHQSTKAQPCGTSIWSLPSLPSLAWAAAALFAVCVSLPRIAQHSAAKSEVVLHADRGSEVAVVPVHQSAILAVDAIGLPTDNVSAQVVNEYGAELWSGRISVRHARAVIVLPPLARKGTYLVRVYDRASSSTDASLLREFVFQAR